MSYAIISVGGKQYRVQEGQRLLVDRVPDGEGATFTPRVLLVGGDGEATVSPSDVTVTVKVLGERRGPKIRIGKYRRRTGYKRHTGFRAALSEIQVESIGGTRRQATPKPKPEAASKPEAAAEPEAARADTSSVLAAAGVPDGYGDMTVAQVKESAAGWDALAIAAALEFERINANRKGAVAALESALKEKEAEG